MNWKTLDSIAALDHLQQRSHERPAVIFKHSTRCSISSMVLSRLEGAWDEAEMEEVDFFFLDLIRHRDVSQEVASRFEVTHQSPQMLIIREGKSVFDASHMSVSYQKLKSQLVVV